LEIRAEFSGLATQIVPTAIDVAVADQAAVADRIILTRFETHTSWVSYGGAVEVLGAVGGVRAGAKLSDFATAGLTGAWGAAVFGVAEIAVIVVAAGLADQILAGAGRLSTWNVAYLTVLALSVGAAVSAASGHALSGLARLAKATVSIRSAAPLGHAITVIADFGVCAVRVAHAFTATGGQAFPVAATLAHGAVLIVSAGAVAGAAASVGAGFSAITVWIRGAGSALRHANVVIAGLSGWAVADVFATRRCFSAGAVKAGFVIRAVTVLLAACRIKTKAVFAALVWVAFGVHRAIRAASSTAGATGIAAGRRTAREQQEGDESDAYI
jgi:hypothetical protein